MAYADFTKVPGPSPWYMKQGLFYRTRKSDYFWKHDESKELSGMTKLINSEGRIVLILDFQCYVQEIIDGKFIIWHEYTQDDKKMTNGRIEFKILDVDKLAHINDYEGFAKNMRNRTISIGYEGNTGLCSEFSLPHLSEGKHYITFPDEFTDIVEVFVLADYTDKKSNYFDEMYRAIYSIHFSEGVIEVYPQDWFNKGNLDFGYQWITQITKRKDGKLCGNGIRIAEFLLDDTNIQIKK